MKPNFYSKRGLGTILLSVAAIFARAQSGDQLWGVTSDDGRYLQGTIFTTASDGTNLTARYQFGYEREGRFVGDMVEYNGEFYATSHDFEADDWNADEGILFKWNPETDEFTILHRFNNATGNNPTAALYLKDDKLYGATMYGGLNDSGVIYEFDPATNAYTKRADLFNVVKQSWTYGEESFTMMNGKFYGVVYADLGYTGNAIFEWDPETSTFSKVKRAAGADQPYDTHEPFTRMTPYQGKLYGVSNEGGSSGIGEIVEWDLATDTFVSRTPFSYPMGRPISPLTEKDGKFYGITSKAELYQWDPVTNLLEIKRTLTAGISTYYSPIGLTLFNGKLYGQANGGASGKGFIYEWDPDTNGFTDKFDYTNGRAGRYQGRLVEWQGKLWGRRPVGVEADNNTEMFSWDPATNIYEGKFLFNVSEGRAAKGGLTLAGSKLYGMTQTGGTSNQGVIYEFDPGTLVYKRLQNLDATKGTAPLGKLAYKNGKLYGMTRTGGLYGVGTIFELDIETNTFTKKVDFVATNGKYPVGSLAEKDGKFYGMTSYGGFNDYGVIFEWDPATNIYIKKIDFDSQTGARPMSDLVAKNGKFYGTANVSGENLVGTLFEWDPVGNAVTKRFDLTNTVGGRPTGSFNIYNNKLYTTTSSGTSYGTILEWDPGANTVQVRARFGTGLPGSMTESNGKFYYLSGDPGYVMEWNPVTDAIAYKSSFTGEWNHILGNRPSYATLARVPEGSLPVRLVDFEAKLQENKGVLEWRSAEESDFSHFEIQRSHDAKHFEPIGRVNPSPGARYTFTDTGLTEMPGTHAYYRLKMIDLDGTFAYSAIEQLTLPVAANFIYPNPAVETLHIKHAPGLGDDWKLADTDGNTVMSGTSNGAPFKLNLGKLGTGTYLLRFSSGQTFKVFKN